MSDQELLNLANLQRKYSDLLGELQKVLRRMRRNNGKADDADRKHLSQTQKKMNRVEAQINKICEKLKNRKAQSDRR